MGTSRTRRAVIGILALLVAVLGAACEDEKPSDPTTTAAEPSTSDTTAPTEPTTTPTGPVEPTLPAAAEAGTKAGVEAFVEFYWAVVNYATKTGDVALLTELAQPSCDTCAAGIQGIERVYERGGRIVGGSYAVVRIEVVPSANDQWTASAHTRVGAQRTVDAGELNGSFPGGRARWMLGLTRADGTWSVSTLEAM